MGSEPVCSSLQAAFQECLGVALGVVLGVAPVSSCGAGLALLLCFTPCLALPATTRHCCALEGHYWCRSTSPAHSRHRPAEPGPEGLGVHRSAVGTAPGGTAMCNAPRAPPPIPIDRIRSDGEYHKLSD